MCATEHKKPWGRAHNGLTGGTLETAKASRQLLARAAVRLGGVEALASQLEISQRVLMLYIQGHEAVPDSLLLRVIDVILDALPGQNTSEHAKQSHASTST
jgi:hypothetical protein